VTDAVTVSATLLAWLGAALLTLSDGRRGIALGLSLTGVGLAVVVLLAGHPSGAGALLAGGLGAGALRLRQGAPGWAIMPPGSTPRIILSLVALAAGAFVGISLTTGPGAPGRVAALAVSGLSVARLFSADSLVAGVAAACALSLALGTTGGLGAQAAGAAVAVALSAMPVAERPAKASRPRRSDERARERRGGAGTKARTAAPISGTGRPRAGRRGRGGPGDLGPHVPAGSGLSAACRAVGDRCLPGKRGVALRAVHAQGPALGAAALRVRRARGTGPDGGRPRPGRRRRADPAVRRPARGPSGAPAVLPPDARARSGRAHARRGLALRADDVRGRRTPETWTRTSPRPRPS
jgi:hypothetical protein